MFVLGTHSSPLPLTFYCIEVPYPHCFTIGSSSYLRQLGPPPPLHRADYRLSCGLELASSAKEEDFESADLLPYIQLIILISAVWLVPFSFPPVITFISRGPVVSSTWGARPVDAWSSSLTAWCFWLHCSFLSRHPAGSTIQNPFARVVLCSMGFDDPPGCWILGFTAILARSRNGPASLPTAKSSVNENAVDRIYTVWRYHRVPFNPLGCRPFSRVRARG